MRNKSPKNEFSEIAEFFFQENRQTSFLMRRMKAHDVFIYEHSLRTAYYSLLLAQGLELSGREQEKLYRSALLQDIGKLRISYKAPGNEAAEREGSEEVPSILLHPEYSLELLKEMDDRGLVDGEAILQHHENLDGTGYPNSLKWTDISLNARILRVADSFAAMTSYDPKSGNVIGIKEALNELYRWSDIMYDTDLVNLLSHYYESEIKEMEKEKEKEKALKFSKFRSINH